MDWKNHPLVIACVSCASTCVFFISVIVPIYEKKNIHTIGELEAKIELLKTTNNNNDKEISTLKKSKQSLSNEIAQKNEKILKLQEEERFSPDTPFPKGFREIGVFQDFEKVKEVYKDSAKPKKGGWIHVDIIDQLFSSATYYQLECKKHSLVSHVLFQLNDPISEAIKASAPIPTTEELSNLRQSKIETLVKIFREKYGQEVTKTEDDRYIFKVKDFWLAEISESGLVIAPTVTTDKIDQICAELKSKSEKKP